MTSFQRCCGDKGHRKGEAIKVLSHLRNSRLLAQSEVRCRLILYVAKYLTKAYSDDMVVYLIRVKGSCCERAVFFGGGSSRGGGHTDQPVDCATHATTSEATPLVLDSSRGVPLASLLYL